MGGRFSGKVVLVAGGTGGLGSAVVEAFLKEGAKTAVTYLAVQDFDEFKKSLGAAAKELEGHAVDVTNEAAVRKCVERIIAKHHALDCLVNTVGGYAGGTKLWDLDSKVFERMVSLNLNAGYSLARAAVRAMLKAGQGSIVNISSKAAFDHAAGAGAYAASKAAAVALMDSLAADLHGTGIRVNTVLPSIIDTAANRKAMPSADFSKWPKPEEIARVILFLCSEEAKVIRGAAIPVYGNS